MANAVTYKSMTFDYIKAWCINNDKVDWLKEIVKIDFPYEVYPKVEKTIINKNGKEVLVHVADKTKKPTIEMRKISFVDLKYQFCKAFMPEILPVKAKKTSMYDEIDAL